MKKKEENENSNEGGKEEMKICENNGMWNERRNMSW